MSSPPGTGRDVPDADFTQRNGPKMTEDEFAALFDDLRTWAPGRPGDERGALVGITDETVRAALASARDGTTISLSLPINRTPAPDNARPALHHMVDLGDVEEPEPSAHKDFIGLDYHGKAVSHLDAVCHIGYRGQLFGGMPSRDVFSSTGSRWAAVTTMRTGVVTRGVLLDLPALRGVEWLEPGTAVRAADLDAAEARFGYRIAPGDGVLLRSGHGARRRELGPWNSDNASAGMHVELMPILARRGVAILGGDGDSDVRPSPVEGVHSPIHALALTALGIPLLDNLDLEALSQACAAAGRYEFLLIVAPLVVPGGTGSPVNPIAVL